MPCNVTWDYVIVSMCSFSRLIAGLDGAPSDFNLDGDYFFLFGRGNVGRCE